MGDELDFSDEPRRPRRRPAAESGGCLEVVGGLLTAVVLVALVLGGILGGAILFGPLGGAVGAILAVMILCTAAIVRRL